MQLNQEALDKSRRVWVLRQSGLFKGRYNVWLAEYEWTGTRWRPTGQTRKPNSLYQAIREADWVGRLPCEARRRTVVDAALVAQVFKEGKDVPARKLAKRLGIGEGTVRRIRQQYSL